MIERKKKLNLPQKYLLIPFLILCVVLVNSGVFADTATTSVTVGNSAPSFDVAPAEDTASVSTSPTNAGTDVTFDATGNDSNGDSYYLAICKTDAVTAVNGGAPTCDGGSWCVSTATADETEASCSYTTLDSDDESNDWYAFVCDGDSSSASCSSSSQGSGDSGSPFKVNHRPTFDTISNDGPQDPGGTVTWSTNASTTDSDTDGTADTVKLVVCKTAGVSGVDCDGGESDRWCQSSLVSDTPSCTYDVPTPTADQSYDAYVYLFDNHDFGADTNQGSSSNYTVNNVAPTVSSVALNGGSAMDLTENTTTSVTITGTVTDNNACGDVASVETSLYRSGVGWTSCDNDAEDDDNSCYAQVSCSVVGSGNTCDGSSDASADYTCSVSVQYHADPTDTNTVYEAENWLSTVKATDDDASTGNAEVSSGVQMNSLTALDITSTISYGTLGPGEAIDPLDQTANVTATGNVGLDVELSGTDMTSNGDSIAVTQQKYALAASTAYADGTTLSTTETEAELNCSKTTDSVSPANKDTYWGIEIPADTPSGDYSGSDTFGAVKGETVDW